MQWGRRIAYRGETPKRCRVGEVASVDNDARKLTVRAYSAAADARLRVKWRPILGDEGEIAKQEVAFEDVLTVVELRSGVLGHAAARKLDIAGWRLDEGVLRQGAVDVAAVLSVVRPTGPSLEPEVLALLRLARFLQYAVETSSRR